MAKIERTIDKNSWIWNDLDRLEPCLILFIHGYTGHAENTWQRFPHLIRQVGQGFETGFDVASFGYKTGLLNTKTIENIAGLFSSFISAHANQYQHIFIVAHSLGGVVSRCLVPQLFAKKPVIFHKIRQIHFIGVPHYGIGRKKSWWVNLFTFLPGMGLSQQLTADSPTLLDILGRWDKLLRQLQDDKIAPPLVTNYVGSEDWVAPYKRIIGEFNRRELVEQVEETHLSLAKPHGPENTLYTLVKKSIQADVNVGVKKRCLTDSDQGFLDEVFETLFSEKALIILAQKGRIDELLVPQEIEQQLKRRFGARNTYFLMPLSGASVKPQKYFTYLAKQLELSGTFNDHSDLETALESRLEHGKSMLLFVRRVENGDGLRADELAGMLRNLLEKTSLQVLLLGNQKLAELRYGKGRVSLLSGITVMQWPELRVEDVRQLYPYLNVDKAQAFLDVSGGVPKLLESCWGYFELRLPVSGYSMRLQKKVAEAFMPFFRNLVERRQVCLWLGQEDLGPTEAFIRDGLLRRLFWGNLLVERDEKLVWRCDSIRMAGEDVLRCSEFC